MSESFDARMAEAFRAVFELPADADPAQIRQVTTKAWDSLGHVSLVAALESEFEVEITAVDSIEITSYGAALLLVEELVAERST